MYKHLRSDVFATWVDRELIVLDVANDSYIVYSEVESKLIATVCGASAAPLQTEMNLDAARNLPIFKIGTYSLPDVRLRKLSGEARGASLNCWRLRQGDIRLSCNPILLLRVFLILSRVHRCSRENRMIGLIRMMRESRNFYCGKYRRALTPIDGLVVVLNLACLIFSRRTKCLEWACTLVLIGHRCGYDLDLVIGVQNRPFLAHAWVELDGEIVGDDPDRRMQFSPIFDASNDG